MSFLNFVKDMMSGGGDLNKHIVPKEIRNAAPKELQPGGFDPARDWLGYDIKANPARDARVKDQQATAAALAAYNQGAPAFRGGGMGPQMGMAPPQSIPSQGGLLSAPQFQGPYNQQALQLASGPAPQPGAYGMPSGPQLYGAPNAGSAMAPYGQVYDNPSKSFRLVPGGYYK
jgi:hypothetical protein